MFKKIFSQLLRGSTAKTNAFSNGSEFVPMSDGILQSASINVLGYPKALGHSYKLAWQPRLLEPHHSVPGSTVRIGVLNRVYQIPNK